MSKTAAKDARTADPGTERRTPPHHRRRPPIRPGRMGASRRDHRRPRQPGVRAAGGRIPEELVPERDQHRRPEVLPRQARIARARAVREADDLPGRGNDRGLGTGRRLLRDGRRRRRLRGRADPHPAPPAGRVQQPGLVQRRVRGPSTVLGLLHPQRPGHDGVDPRLEHQGGDDLPGRVGVGDQPLAHPLLGRAPLQGWAGLRPGQLHARRRRVGRHHQVRRQDPAGGQDGRARRRPSRHRGLHLVQGARGGEGGRAARRRLRHAPGQRLLPFDPVPERQQLRPGDGRVHGGRRGGRRLGPDGPHDRRGAEDAPVPRPHAPDRRRSLALRRSGRSIRHHDQPLAHLPGVGADQRVEPVLGVHARGRFGVQPRLDQPDEVPQRGRELRRRGLLPRRGRRLLCPGDRRGPLELPDRRDRPQCQGLPPDRTRLREPRRAPDVERASVRLRRGSLDGGRDHGADDRARLSRVGRDRRAGGHL